MKDLRNWFANPFADRNISYEKLKLFAADVIARLTNNNGSGLFTTVLAQLVAAYQSYFGDITDVDLAAAVQKSFTASKDNLFATFKAAVSRQEGLVKSTFGKDSPTYMEFFPLGLSEYSQATMANVETLMNRMVSSGQAHVTDLGTDFVSEFQNILSNYQSARTAQLGRKSITSDERTERHATRAELETQLFSAMFTVGLNFPGNVDRCMDFFDQTIVQTSSGNGGDGDTESLTGTVPPMSTKNVVSGLGGTATMNVRNTGAVAFVVCTANSEMEACTVGQTVNPGELYSATGGSASTPAWLPFLNITNNDPTGTASYEVTIT